MMLKCVILIRTLLLDCQFWWEAQLKKKSGGCFHFMIKIGMGSFPGRYNRMKMEKSGFCMIRYGTGKWFWNCSLNSYWTRGKSRAGKFKVMLQLDIDEFKKVVISRYFFLFGIRLLIYNPRKNSVFC